jgi:hypothetical protein
VVPVVVGDLTPAAKAFFEGMGKAVVDRFAPSDVADTLAEAFAAPARHPTPPAHDPTPPVHQQLNALRQEVEMLRKQMGQLEDEVRTFHRLREDLEGASFDRAMARVWGSRWNPAETLKTKRPARPGLGLSEEEWAAVLKEV